MNEDPNPARPAGSPGDAPDSSSPSLGRFCLYLALLIGGAFPLVLAGVNSFFYRDYGVLAYPFVQFHHDAFWSGNPFPLWNPLSNCGAPFLAQWGTMVLYPFSLVYLLLPLPWSLGVFILGHLGLGGVGMFLLAWRWTGQGSAAAFAGVAFAFSGFTLSAHVWPNYMVALAWMPLLVLMTEKAWCEGGRSVVLAGVVAALQVLAGVPEIALLTWIAVGLLFVVDLARRGSPKVTMTLRLLMVVVLAAGLTSVQLLPFLDLLAHSQRDAGFATSKWAMPSWGWAHLLVPLFHAFITPQWTWFQEGQEFVSSFYPGVGVVVLALTALVVGRDRRVWCLAALAALGFLLALGEQGFVLPWLRRVFPELGVARYPIKAVVLVTFALPLLAAFALSSGARAERSRRAFGVTIAMGLLTLAAMGAILAWAKAHPFPYDQWMPTLRNAGGRALVLVLTVAGVVAWRRGRGDGRRGWILPGLLMVLAADGLTHWPNLVPTIPAANFEAGLARAALDLQPAPGAGGSRVMISPAAEERLLRSGVSDWQTDFLGKRRALWSNLNALDRMPKVNGSSTLQIREQAEVQRLLYASPTNELPALMDFLAVSHVTKPGTVVEWTPRPSAMPFVSAGQEPVWADATNALQGVADPGFNPRTKVFLPAGLTLQPPPVAAPGARAELSHFTSEHLTITVECEQPAVVVIAQTFHPAWQARIDGRPAPVHRANHAFQAVVVPAGRHELRLDYVDRRFRLGAVISGVSLLFCGLGWFLLRGET